MLAFIISNYLPCAGIKPRLIKEKRMKLLHQILGILVVVIFLLTGQYMGFYYPEMEAVDDGTRMMLRSRHIYILLAGLINLGIGVYFSWRPERWRKSLQILGSIFILVAPLLLIGAFFYEPRLANLQSSFTLPAMISLLAGTLIHLLSGIKQRLS
jgi:hypothetical protein